MDRNRQNGIFEQKRLDHQGRGSRRAGTQKSFHAWSQSIECIQTHCVSSMCNQVTRRSKHILPHLGRFCLVSTFIEDGLRMYYQWNEQRHYLAESWSVPQIIASTFVFYNLVAQLSASGMALLKYKSNVACAILFSVIILQVKLEVFLSCFHLTSKINFFCRPSCTTSSPTITF